LSEIDKGNVRKEWRWYLEWIRGDDWWWWMKEPGKHGYGMRVARSVKVLRKRGLNLFKKNNTFYSWFCFFVEDPRY